MCGIAGVLGQGDIRRMTSLLSHRGPDDEGVFVQDSTQFGCRRLAIVDRDAGRQPMQSATGRSVVVFNGEIYNYQELRQELKERHEFRTRSDTEVVLHAYEEYGPACLDRFNGMFALAIWDGTKLFLARDRLGEKPLYYYWDSRRFMFASEIKCILSEIPAVPSIPEEFVVFETCVGDQTLFEQVRTLPPAHYLTFDGETVEVHRYWNLPKECIETTRTEDSYVEELRWLIEDAVRLRLQNDMPVGFFVSGGLDSSLLACLARPDFLYTCNYPLGAEFDELDYATILSEHLHTPLEVVRPGPWEFKAFLPKMIYALDEPVATASSFSTFMLAQRASQDVKVVLQGEGADELFGGYVRYLLMCAERDLGQLDVLKNYYSLARFFWNKDIFGPAAGRYFHLIKRNEPSTDGPARRVADVFDRYSQLVSQMGAVDLDISFPSVIHMNDRANAAFGLENRLPFLDHRIIEFAFRLPDDLKIRQFTTKYLLRRVARQLVPAAIVDRTVKRGLVTPVQRWLNQELRGWAGGRIKKALDVMPVRSHAARGDFDRQNYWLLTIQIWCEVFGIDPAALALACTAFQSHDSRNAAI